MEKDKNKDLLKLFQSADKDLVLNAIKELRDEGSDKVLELLTQIYVGNSSKEINEAIYKIFCDLKNQQSTETVIELINNATDKEVKKMLTSSCWQSRLNYILYLETFISMVLNEPFEIAFEAFTVIENIESRVSANRKNELYIFIDAQMDTCLDDNQVLADDLKGIIRQYAE